MIHTSDNSLNFYIDGEWCPPTVNRAIDVINPATERPFAQISLGTANDVDRALGAAQSAFEAYSEFSVAERDALLQRIIACYENRMEDIAQAITREMGCPIDLSREYQAPLGRNHFVSARRALTEFDFEYEFDHSIIKHEPIGVCGLITPWNWPINQVAVKVAPALAAGCTVVLKPSEVAPFDAMILAEIMHEAKVPAGVFNLVNGTGPEVGQALSNHNGVQHVSFTGSIRGGVAVAKAAADTVKRVSQELGGKSANIILRDANLDEAIAAGVRLALQNSGQSCNAPTRMLVPEESMTRAFDIARRTVDEIVIGDPLDKNTTLGPVANETQYNRIQEMITVGIDENAQLVTGGLGRPDHLSTGFFVRPTVFGNVGNDMRIAQEEIFGPVLCLLPYHDEEQAIDIANASLFGLAGYVSSNNLEHALSVASRIRAGQVAINYVGGNTDTPFGGFKQSGNGREKGRWGLMEFLEVKAITGALTADKHPH